MVERLRGRMKSDENIGVDQAVYGYSNGHRQLASSIDLSSIDMYELAAASDLAPGVSITADESYLTGLMLPDSKRYALIRTWLAPEMPRPGCVWSHVLVLGREVLTSLVDLTILDECFQRPANYKTDKSVTTFLAVNRLRKGKRARADIVEEVMQACYGDISLKAQAYLDRDRENAILAIWSQQWPRMRSRFAFRSLPSTAELKDQTLRFHKGVSLRKSVHPPEWVQEATKDVVSGRITELRRFLWRYGKDIKTANSTFRSLVSIYLATRERIDSDLVDQIFGQFGDGEAETLKRDLLGLSSGKLALVPSIEIGEFIRVLKSYDLDVLPISENELISLFLNAAAKQFPDTVFNLYYAKEKLERVFVPIKQALITLAKGCDLTNERIPNEFVFEVVNQHSGLLDAPVIGRLSNDELYKLLPTLSKHESELVLLDLMRRGFDRRGKDLIAEIPERMFVLAVDLYKVSELNHSWVEPLRDWFSALSRGLPALRSGEDLIATVRILGFRIGPPDVVDLWYEALMEFNDDLDRDDQTRMLVYLLTCCIHHGLVTMRRVLIGAVPELRARILRGDVPNDAREMLWHWLPPHDPSWDLNWRLLKLFRKAYKQGDHLGDILDALNLTDKEYAYATNQDPDSFVRELVRVLTPPWLR